MRRMGVVALLSAGLAWSGFGADRFIGVVAGIGSYSVNESPSTGTTNLTDGARVETALAPSQVVMENGTAILFGTRSAGVVSLDRLLLQRGAARVEAFDPNFKIRVNALEIGSDEPNTKVLVRTTGRTVEVASLGGSVRVTDDGVRMTRVMAGAKMFFDQENGAPASAKQANQQTASQTGASRAPTGPSDRNTVLWFIGITGGAAIVIGSLAAAEGKSPF
ncbi:MAG: hypothetical protein JO061_00500 [Acidobacteriaceae bacterium]|nr:hypothetical protein [Acidobacteriaceae bacterium]